MEFLDITPSYPVREISEFRTLVAEAESGVEIRTSRWTFPRRAWDIVWNLVDKSTEAEVIEELNRKVGGEKSSFYWKEPHPTTRYGIYLGVGTGVRSAWVLPVWIPSSITVRVGSTITTSFTVTSFGGVNSHHILKFSPRPSSGSIIHVDYRSGYYTPVVRFVGPLIKSLVKPSWNFCDLSATVRETKEELGTV